MRNRNKQLLCAFLGAAVGIKLGLMLGELLWKTPHKKPDFTFAGGVHYVNRAWY